MQELTIAIVADTKYGEKQPQHIYSGFAKTLPQQQRYSQAQILN